MTDRYANNAEAGRKAAARLDTFVDTAFGFAVTLLVISGGAMPVTGAQLADALLHVPAFLLSFALVARMWLSHRAWSARYGLYDGMSTFLSLLLVALVLIFIFPLHAMFEAFAAVASNGILPSRYKIESYSDLRTMYTAFGAMFVCFGIVLAAMHLRAWEIRDRGAYSPAEARSAAGSAVAFVWMAVLGLASIIATEILVHPGTTWTLVSIPPSLYFLFFFMGTISRNVSALLEPKE